MFVRIICLLLCIGTFQEAFAGQRMVLAIENSWPPFADADGQGISRQLIEKAMEDSEFDVSFIVVPYSRALQMAEYGQVDGCLNVTRQQDTEEKFLFGQQPLLQATASFYYPQGSAQEYESITDVPSGTSIGLITGYEYGNEFEAQRHRFREVRVANQRQLIGLLDAGRIDMAIMFDQVAAYTLSSMALSLNHIRRGALNQTSDIYVAFSRGRDEEQIEAMMAALDKGLNKLRHQPKIQEEHL